MPKRIRLGQVDLPEGGLRGFEREGRLICLVRKDGRWLAIDDWCNHAGCLLSGGHLDATAEGRPMVVCPCHEIGFDAETGKNSTSPGICDDQTAFRVHEEEGELVIEIPDPGGDGGTRGA